AIGAYLERVRPGLVLAQGDTTTVLASALACYYHKTSFGHVEAGLRTGHPFDPFPEEKNRVLASHLADIHFAPTPLARRNLLREGIPEARIHVTGNPVIDALKQTADRDFPLPIEPATPNFLLVTLHRRENFGAPLERICQALRELVDSEPALSVVFPVHPNPQVRGCVFDRLGGHGRILLIDPVGYRPFVALMKAAVMILTDSGGVQEEAPSLGKPVLVLRETTERPEAVEAGTVQVVGTVPEAILTAVRAALTSEGRSRPGSLRANPYGDGWTSERITRILLARFGVDLGPLPLGFSVEWPPAESKALGERRELLGEGNDLA
ncbi:non-hydrolyzing UDP-N-acetylglucosamine 2-epimerase, partial [Singulisphaera rosea]